MRKYKTIAIPVTFTDDVPRFLTVRDKRFKEWIFVTGGCKKREEYFPLKCALRELEEETRGIIKLKMGEYTHFKFSVNENGDILEYSVFIFFVNISRDDQNNIINKFNNEKDKMQNRIIPLKKAYDENDLLSFDTLSEFKMRQLWERINCNVINNPNFYSCVTSKKRKKFNIINNEI